MAKEIASATSTASAAGQLRCVVVTPEATVLDVAARFVVLPLYDGEIGILPGHSPMIGRLGYGEMRIESSGPTQSYYIDGGFVQVAADVVSVLTGRAVPAEQLDSEVAQEQITAALRRPAHSDEMIAIRNRHLAQSRAQLRLARRRAAG